MKKLTVLLICIAVISVFFSCDMTVALGSKIEMDGPIVVIDYPHPRQPVDGLFYISGSVSDKTGIDYLIVKAQYFLETGNGVSRNADFPMQWRYKNKWEISFNSGNNWSDLKPVTLTDGTVVQPEWSGDNLSAKWKVPVDMTLSGIDITDGLYQFNISAVSTSGFSDENSLKTRNVILYKIPPKVSILLPSLFNRQTLIYPDSELSVLAALTNYKDPIYFGKLLNNKITLQWQIEDKNDVWAIDIRFYEIRMNGLDFVPIDDYENDYVFKMFINDIQNRPIVPSPDQTLKPNGRIEVPNLNEGVKSGIDNGVSYEVTKTVTGNTPLQIVVRCMNAAGFEIEERIMGCFVYWPQSDIPWINFPEGMSSSWTDNLYTVFPVNEEDESAGVPSKAYDDDGIEKVVYSIYAVNPYGVKIDENNPDRQETKFNTLKTRNFSWNFKPPREVAAYIIEAETFDIYGLSSGICSAYFKTMDISWPDIKLPYTPVSIEPLYRFINGANANDWQFTIRGYASDSSKVKSVTMVWINPHSINYSAMSQLAYFRDPNYEGWTEAEQSAASPYLDGKYDSAHPNKVWKLDIPARTGAGYNDLGMNALTRRYEVEYNKTLRLRDDLNILPGMYGYDYLKSQTFVFKVTGGTDNKSSIIVWAPEGASIAPEIKIDGVSILRSGVSEETLVLGKVEEIGLITPGDVIVVTGTWKEDSALYLGKENAIKEYFNVSIGSAPIPKNNAMNTTFNITPSADKVGNGRWEVRAIVGSADAVSTHALRQGHLRDTLMVNAKIVNVGGHPSEDMQTWFIATDQLRFLKLGSDTSDSKPFRSGGVIEFYLEFNKKVKLKPGVAAPELRLNSTNIGIPAIAVYNTAKNNDYSTLQYFTYTVSAGHSTENLPGDKLLNISALNTAIAESAANYPFTFVTENDTEELIMAAGGVTTNYRYVLPMESNTASGSLKTIKSFEVDTTPPVLNRIVISGKGGWYGGGETLILSADFNETVSIDSASPPSLSLQISNGGSSTPQSTDRVEQNGSSLLFFYDIKSGDYTTGTNLVVITAFTGVVKDFAGNDYANSSFGLTTTDFKTPKSGNGTGSGARVRAIPLSVPTLAVYSVYPGVRVGGSDGLSSSWNPSDYADSDAFNNSGVLKFKLNNYYSDNLIISIESAADFETGFDRLEYSIDYGKTWKRENSNAIRLPQTVQGNYDLTARRTDAAGNSSPWSRPVTLYWDKGDLLTRITTDFPSGIYTDNAIIPITLTFRRPVMFTEVPQLRISIEDRINGAITYRDIPGTIGTVVSENITINYTIGSTDTTNGKPLEVVGLAGKVVDVNNVDVSYLVNLDKVNSDHRNLADQKSIIVQTGRPIRLGDPVFTRTTINEDDSVSGNITMTFNSIITRGIGEIEIIQKNDDYRLPGVLTEAQYNLYKGIHPNFGDYYKKGINGYNNTTNSPDTSTKYILDFNVDTFSTQYKANGDGAVDAAKTTQLTTIRNTLREEEKISIMINSTFVTFSGNTVTIALTQTNSLKVQGAQYELKYPEGFIIDTLGNMCEAYDGSIPAASVGTLAKPYIRVRKPSEKISEQAGTTAVPRFYVAPGDRATRAWARMDTRTPGAQVRYTTASSVNGTGTNVTAVNLLNTDASKTPSANPARPGAPTAASTLFGSASALIQVGDTPGAAYTLVQGLKYRIYAVSEKSGTVGATFSDEMLFRSVLTFEGVTGLMSNQQFDPGDQVWVRGGNNMTSSTIAGFPLTWEDNYEQLELNKEQAGIRLLTRITDDTTTVLRLSRWQWITWDINVPAYITLFLGRGGSDAQEVRQYGPEAAYVQRENWTFLNEYYQLFPGQHRYLNTQTPDQSAGNGRQGPFYFNATPERRPIGLDALMAND